MLLFFDALILGARKRAETLGWVDWGHIRLTVYSYYVFILVKIDKDKRLVVLDEELEVCLVS